MIDNETQKTERSLAKAGKACKLINMLMKAMLVILCLWWALSIAVMAGSIVRPDLFDNPNPVNAVSLIIYIAHCAAVAVMCISLVRIFTDASKGRSPFTMLQVRRLRLVSIALLAYAIFEFGLTCSTTFMKQDWVSASIDAAPTLNLFPVIAAAVVFAFSFVFKYGVLLQELSDETL